MKKIITRIIICVIGVVLLAFIFIMDKDDKKNSDLTKVKVAEVAHTIFYAPQYAALANGYF